MSSPEEFSNGQDDNTLLESVYLQYKDYMFAIAQSLVHNRSDAEDAVHEVFLKISQRYMDTLRRITSDRDLKNYLLSSVRNTALSILKRRQREFSEDMEDVQTQHTMDDSLFDQIIQQIEYEKVINALAELPLQYKEVLYYHFVLEYSIKETAEILHRKPGVVKVQLVRGKKSLIDIIKSKDGF